MPLLTGTIRSAAGDLLTGLLEVKALQPRKSDDATATIGPAYNEIAVTNGVITPTTIESGPIRLSTRFEGWMQDFHPTMPGEAVDFWDLIESTIPYAPEIVSVTVTARDEAVAAAEDAQEILDQVGLGVVPDAGVATRVSTSGSATRAAVDARVTAVGNATYAPVNPDLVITRNATGAISGVTQAGKSITYTRDALGRITAYTFDGVTKNVTRSALGAIQGVSS